MKKLIGIVAVLVLASGCTMLHTKQTDTTAEGLVTQTSVTVYSILGGKSDLAKLRTTSTANSQGMSIGTLGQDSITTNTVSLVEAVTAGAVRGAIEATKK